MPGLGLARLEDEITTLAAHISAGTCRFLELVSEFDRREGWASSGCGSCAEWLSWRCGLSPRTAREHVRVANRLADLPRVRERFRRGVLSFSQTRAICRVADPSNEEMLVEFARHSTAAQLERIVSSYRGVLARDLAANDRAYEQRHFTHHLDDDGSLVFHGRLPAEEGALLLAALEAARGSAEPQADPDGSAEPDRAGRVTNADALVRTAELALAGAAGGADSTGAARTQLVVHVDAATLAHDDAEGACHVERGPALHPETARRLGCDAAVVRILEADGKPLTVGRRTRTVSPALRRGLDARDHGCCRFPGCTNTRFVDAHHIHHWAHGGRTELDNLVTLCRRHHRLLHEGGYSVVPLPGGRLRFHRPDGAEIPLVPSRPPGDHREVAGRRRDLAFNASTATPDWDGQRLDLQATTAALADADHRLRPDRAPPVPAG